MAYSYLVRLLILLFATNAFAKIDKLHSEGYLGEKSLDSYSGRYQPLIFQDIYQGKIVFRDEIFFQNYFHPYLFNNENDFSFFLKSELNSGMTCSNELLSEHYNDIRYSYRLITLSYLIEAGWKMQKLAQQFGFKKSCDFDNWIKSCNPKSSEMKNFVKRLQKYRPQSDEVLPKDFSKSDWWRKFSVRNKKDYSHQRISTVCKGECSESSLEKYFDDACAEDEKLMSLICSEEDEIYGLSLNKDAYYLVGISNIVNTYNAQGEAMGCLRRFSEVMSHKEVKYDVLKYLFPTIQSYLRGEFQERYLQGRVFLYGASKEFEDKGLKEIFVADQKLEVPKLPDEGPVVVKVEEKKEQAPPKVIVKKLPSPKKVVKKEVEEIRKPMKSAFLQAAESRNFQNLDKLEVDMLKLKYDYVFTLTMINSLRSKLKTFMTRTALTEMMTYDKLGSREGPVPLLFIKFMIDMEEHQGLYNLISVLGERFYVSNEIDESFRPEVELIQLQNINGQWQLFVLKP